MTAKKRVLATMSLKSESLVKHADKGFYKTS